MAENTPKGHYRVRITVMKRLFHKDLIQLYAGNPDTWTQCKTFHEGQEFITDLDKPWNMPEGFCGWAWADIQKTVYGMARGGRKQFITCCTDGYRPVVFLLEQIRE